MIQRRTILAARPFALGGIDLPNLGDKYSGKVRDFYIADDQRIIVTTDRQSAFDVNLGLIPFKGAVLNQLAAFWFAKTKHIIPNHLIAVPDPNVLISKNCTPIPVEMIVRGYMSGVTKTSVWYSYQRGERIIYGLPFPDGLKKNELLPSAIITPTTHPEAGSNLHDERLTREEIVDQGIVDEALYQQMEKAAFALFAFGQSWSEQHGLILVDTKYEFGLCDGQLMLIDEIHTPDSSRFWIKDTYSQRLNQGDEPDNYDKEFLRIWYADHGYRGDGAPPPMPEDLMVDVSRRYIGAYEKLTGQPFQAFRYPIEQRIIRNVQKYQALVIR